MKPWIKYVLTGLVAFIVGVAAASSDTSTTKTQTVTETAAADTAETTPTKTETVTQTVTHRVRARAPKQAPAPQQAKSYSGNGGKSLGTLEIPNGATLKWTNDGGLMQILTEGPDPVPVNSQGHSGETELQAGTYSNFQVNSVGNWTIQIVEH